jgi:uncharacterized integral membrane protein
VSQGDRPEGGPPDRRPRTVLIAIGAVVGLLFVVQNSGAAEVNLLWFTVRMPLIFVLVAMVALGIGLDRAWLWRQRRR